MLYLDKQGEQKFGCGNGYGQGWYYYGNKDIWIHWFDNGQYDPNGKTTLDYSNATVLWDPNYGGCAEISCVWSKSNWSVLGYNQPPLPADVPTSGLYDSYIQSHSFLTIGVVPDKLSIWGSIEPVGSREISQYCPGWIGIGVRGRNIATFRLILQHDCVPKDAQMGACCNHETGDCYTSYENQCQAPYEWLGASSSCSQCEGSGEPPQTQWDFGDAPDPPYTTLLAIDGPRHAISGTLFLGQRVDAESDGQPNTTATGDDNSTSDDEDGVEFNSTLFAGSPAVITVTASAAGILSAWVDFDVDGTFSSSEEQIFKDVQLSAGENSLAFSVPASASPGTTVARFRFSTAQGLGYKGSAPDGEVEDYLVSIDEPYEPQPASGKCYSKWSQPPVPYSPNQPDVLHGWGEGSALHLHRIAADDWLCRDERPITAVHWWGSFEGWQLPYPPLVLPTAFHIAVWTDVPSSGNQGAFSHPGTLVWENYCTNWAWRLSGYDKDPRGQHDQDTCFQFTHIFSQDEWFYQDPNDDPNETSGTTVYWVSIAAVYDTQQGEPQYLWGWKTREHFFNDAAVRITSLETMSQSGQTLSQWPPVVDARWSAGEPISFPESVTWDMAFELTTNQPAYEDNPILGDVNQDGVVNLLDIAILAQHWLEAAQ